MADGSSVICLEFNELTPSLLDRFLNEGHLPNFQRLKDQSVVQTTDANAQGEWLNPWVQWVTVHSGLDASEHEVYRLSNAYRLKVPAIWDLISQAGQQVWVCGSMNPWCSEELNGHMLPDPWSHQVHSFPEGEFDNYDSFVRKNVQDYAARKSPASISDRIRFIRYMLNNGLKVSTIQAVLKQLVLERMGNHRWKRASILDAFQFDLFEQYYARHRPAFATFFSNSTAHYQHKYWRNMAPEEFLIRPTASEQRALKNAILYGYKQMDALVGRVLKMASRSTIMLISGLSQKPFQEKDQEGGVRYYRLHGKESLTKSLRIAGEFSYEPIMADEFFLRFVNEIDAEACADRLASILLPDGNPAFSAELDGSDVIAQCKCRFLMPSDATLTIRGSAETISFDDVFYWVDSVKSGTHHPEGIFWVRQPGQAAAVREEPVSLTTIAPTILDVLGVDKPDFMQDQSIFAETSEASREPQTSENLLVGV